MKKIAALLAAVCLTASLCPAFAASASDFTDVSQSDWYYDAVSYAVENSLFSGTTATTFSPNAPLSRGMFVTVIGNLCGASGHSSGTAKITEAINLRSKPSTDSAIVKVLNLGDSVSVYGLEDGWYSVSASGSAGYIRSDLISPLCGPFADISAGAYYSKYVLWAYERGIVSGTASDKFSPEKNVTRQELCGMLYKLAKVRSLTIKQTLSRAVFADESSIASYFLDAVYALQQGGVVSGRSGGLFCPKDGASRAEAAAMLKSFIVNTGAASASYDYSGAVPESSAVPDSYFDDACFIGHSLVQGMQTTFSLPQADFYAVNGISASAILNYSDFTLPDGGTGTLADALSQKTYGKVYVMLGVNELSSSQYERQKFYDSMAAIIDLIKEKEPAAKVYVISLTPVTKTQSDSGSPINLDNIKAYDDMLQQLSREKSAGYLDFFSLFADADGCMPPDGAASDGIHPAVGQYPIMKQYIKTHTY
jgi:hypothetical protein